MSKPNAELSQPPGDRDIPPALDLELEALDRAMETVNDAHAGLKLARKAADWPTFEAAAHRLAGACRHLAMGISAARAREAGTKEGKS